MGIVDFNIDRYVQDFPNIDRSLIGKKIGQGAQHLVYLYSKESVIKIPQKIAAHSGIQPTASEIKRNIQVLEKYASYFYTFDGVLHTTKNHDFYIIQEKLWDTSTQYISKNNIAKNIHQFKELLAINNTIVKNEKLSIDFTGLTGAIRCIADFASLDPNAPLKNIVVLPNEKLFIADLGLLDLNHHNKISKKIYKLCFQLQETLIQNHYKKYL